MVILEEQHEFTWDMIRTLPKVYYCHINNIPYKVKCKKNLTNLYSIFSGEVEESNHFNGVNSMNDYDIVRPDYTLQNWYPPPLKEMFKNYLKFDKPTIVIQNKYTLEWNKGPFNFFSIDFLDEFFNLFKEKYQIIYIRAKEDLKNYFFDDNQFVEFNDFEFIKNKHPEVITIYDLMEKNLDLDFNKMQFAIHSTSENHVSVSGGNACLSAYFGGNLIIFDNPEGVPNRGIWKTNSWLNLLGGSKIYGVNDYKTLIELSNKIF